MTGYIESFITTVQNSNYTVEDLTLFSAIFSAIFSPICTYFLLKKEITATKENLFTQFQLQNSSKDTYEYLTILLKILKNLDVLQNTLIYGGKFCDPLDITCLDTDVDNAIANRIAQFKSFGYEIIEETNKFIFIANKQEMPVTVALCKEIRDYLLTKKTGQKNTLGILMQTLNTSLTERKPVRDECEIYQKKFFGFYNSLTDSIEKELPTLRSQVNHKISSINSNRYP